MLIQCKIYTLSPIYFKKSKIAHVFVLLQYIVFLLFIVHMTIFLLLIKKLLVFRTGSAARDIFIFKAITHGDGSISILN